jgi:PLP dependent protein
MKLSMQAQKATEDQQHKATNGATPQEAVSNTLRANLAAVQARIVAACQAVKRDASTVSLLAVSKTMPAEAVLGLAQAGQRDFGENYLQEALGKIASCPPDLVWHFIGPIQSNKTKPVAEHFSWVHSVERLKIAQRLSQQRPDNLPPLNICLQINVSEEDSKSGCAPEQAVDLACELAQLRNISLRGLMAIPEPGPQAQASFAQMQALHASIREQLRVKVSPECAQRFDTLSMGMSGDLELAVAHGATVVRVGTALFGARNYP